MVHAAEVLERLVRDVKIVIKNFERASAERTRLPRTWHVGGHHLRDPTPATGESDEGRRGAVEQVE